MAKESYFAGLDIGSKSISAAAAAEDGSGKIKIKAVVSQELPKGLERGIVMDIGKVSDAITSVMDELEDKLSPGSTSEINIGIRGESVQSVNNEGICNIIRTDKEINLEDVYNVIENAKALHIKEDREIIHVIPQEFSVNKKTGYENPIGHEGTPLGVKAHIVHTSVCDINNISHAIANSGFPHNEIIYHLYPLCEMLLSEEEKKIGTFLIDFGAETISLAAYKKGKIFFSKELPIGMDAITFDISKSFTVSSVSARLLKEKYGFAVTSAVKDLQFPEQVEVTAMDDIRKKKVKVAELKDIIQFRLEEILLAVREEFAAEISTSEEAPLSSINNAVITGGGALLRGMPEAVTKVLGINETRMATLNPDSFLLLDEAAWEQKYFSAIAVASYPILVRSRNEFEPEKKKYGSFKKWVSVVKELLR
ncbi:MAG: cell division protein FtsA [Elusimicrobiota bacterium]